MINFLKIYSRLIELIITHTLESHKNIYIYIFHSNIYVFILY